MAAKYWPGKDPIGQRLKVKDKWMQIVGVAKNVNYETKLEAPKSFFYVPVRQNFFVGNALLIRTRETPGAITNALAREVHALDPTLARTLPIVYKRKWTDAATLSDSRPRCSRFTAGWRSFTPRSDFKA